MPGTNDYCEFQLADFDLFAGEGFPKGDLIRIAVNPWNGKVVLSYQRGFIAMQVIESLIDQYKESLYDLYDFYDQNDDHIPIGFEQFIKLCKGEIVVDQFEPCPFCGCIPAYEHGSICCCDGHLVMNGYSDLSSAVKAWNSRSAFVRKAS